MSIGNPTRHLLAHRLHANFPFLYLGASIYSFSLEVLPPHGIAVTNGDGKHPGLACISGSLTPNVGTWFKPDGTDITNNDTDAFDVTPGDSSDPGYLKILLNRPLTAGDLGLYTCVIPDTYGVLLSVYVGIYHPDYTCKLCSYNYKCCILSCGKQ